MSFISFVHTNINFICLLSGAKLSKIYLTFFFLLWPIRTIALRLIHTGLQRAHLFIVIIRSEFSGTSNKYKVKYCILCWPRELEQAYYFRYPTLEISVARLTYTLSGDPT